MDRTSGQETLSGCTATTTNGVAAFSGCSINTSSDGDIIGAGDETDGLSVSSATFDVVAPTETSKLGGNAGAR